eukprot:12985790-Alexandrium_andersonii.AAC.1
MTPNGRGSGESQRSTHARAQHMTVHLHALKSLVGSVRLRRKGVSRVCSRLRRAAPGLRISLATR